MKTILLFLGVAGMMGGEPVTAPEACQVPAATGEKSGHTRFDPLVIDLKGDGVASSAPATCNAATATAAKEVKPITLKGDVKVTASQNTQSLRGSAGQTVSGATQAAEAEKHAINTKGTGAAGKAAAPGPGRDCDDTASDRGAAAIQPTKAEMAIKCKGTGAQ